MTKSRALADMRPAAMLTFMMIALLVLSACVGAGRADRATFDGQSFRTTSKKLDNRRLNFEVSVRPVSASTEGAILAGRFEATRYCVGNFGTSDVEWTSGPDAEGGQLTVSRDRLVVTGACAPR